VLVELLKDSDREIRLIAAEALGKVGPKGGAAVSALFEAIRDTDAEVRREVEDALFRIDRPAAEAAGLGRGRWWR
jgi:HEAT repeat protein